MKAVLGTLHSDKEQINFSHSYKFMHTPAHTHTQFNRGLQNGVCERVLLTLVCVNVYVCESSKPKYSHPMVSMTTMQKFVLSDQILHTYSQAHTFTHASRILSND